MIYSVVDMGTNTFQLLVAQKNEGKFEIKENIQTPVQLGLGAMKDYILQPEALERAKLALKEYEQIIQSYGINVQPVALGTSILRNAKNKDEFFDWIRSNTIIQPKLISGDQEAQFIFQGILQSLPQNFDKTGLVIDIGGGSTEFILFKGNEILFRHSFEIGGLKLLSLFEKEGDFDKTRFSDLKKYIEKTLQPLFEIAKDQKGISLIGSAGAFETFYELECGNKGIEKNHAYSNILDQTIYDEHARFIKSSSLNERENMKGMKKFRSRIIPYSVGIVEVVRENLTIQEIIVSNFSMKEGYFFSGEFQKL